MDNVVPLNRMDHLVRPLLSQAKTDSICQQLSAADLPWLDGKLTAGEQAASVKKNHQLDPESPLAIQVANTVSEALKGDALIRSFALIRKVHSVLISCSASGDGYGWHVDNPFSRYGRRDLSFTVFLSDQSSYQGGILQLQTGQNGEDFRCSAGEVVVYPSSCLHCVSPVTEGTRYACVGWIESYVKSAEDRALLFSLDAGARGLLAKHGRSDELDLLFQAYSNAVRRLSN